MGTVKHPDWRTLEPSYQEVKHNHPEVSPFVILKTDLLRRGVRYTPAALEQVDPQEYITASRNLFKEVSDARPVSLLLRDGSSVFLNLEADYSAREPYVIDFVAGRHVIVDQDEIIEEVDFWRKPDYYNQTTSRGIPMSQVVTARPQRLDINPNNLCHFWDKPGGGCKYCVAGPLYRKEALNHPETLSPDDVRETIAEALKQKGRYSAIMFTGGTILSGAELLDDEVELYIDIINAVGDNFTARRFPSQLIGTAFSKKQLTRIYAATKIMTYTADLEVFNEEKFNWICPGKAEFIGYQGWKQRLYDAVEIFGSGYVNSGSVSGVELAAPHGFKSEEEALKADLEEIEDLAAHGVSVAGSVWTVSQYSLLKGQKTPSLDYYARLYYGIDQLRRKYQIPPYMDDYRRCGTHPNNDLGRI